MARTSSTKKAAKLAQRSGRRATVRFQGGALFPMVVAAVLIAGMLLVIYARESRPSAGASPPTVGGDQGHWHMPYGFYLCGPKGKMNWYTVNGDKHERTSDDSAFVSNDYQRTGVHSHDDGLMHWHAFSSAATGRNAKLDVFLDVYGIDLSDGTLKIADDQLAANGGQFPQVEYDEDATKCGDEDGELRVQAWGNFTDTDDGVTYTTGMDDIHMDDDGMLFAIVFGPDDLEVPKPPSGRDANEVRTNSAVDQEQTDPESILEQQTPPQEQAPVETTPTDTAAESAPTTTG